MKPHHHHLGLGGQGDYVAPGIVSPRAGGSFSTRAGGPAPGVPNLIPTERGSIAELETTRGTPPPAGPTPRPIARPPCAYEQCHQQVETAAFAWIDVALPALEVGDAGLSYWYGLRSIDVGRAFAQQIRVIGLHYRLLPCDVAGVGYPGMSNPLAWGDATGLSAAVLIGVNLPCRVGAWTLARSYAQGVNITALPNWQRNTGVIDGAAADPALPRLLFGPLRFPTGQLSDVAPNVAESDISLQGDCAPVVLGERIDVALVVDTAYVANRTGQLAGFAQIDLVLGHTIATKAWNV